MEGINRFLGDNWGGLNALYAAYASDVVAINYLDSSREVVTSIQLEGDTAFQQIYFTRDKGGWRETDKETDQGTLYDVEVKVAVPKERISVLKFMREAAGKGLILLAYDNSGNTIVIGTKSQPVYIRRERSSGDALTSKAGAVFTFKGIIVLHPSPYLQGSVALNSDPPFDAYGPAHDYSYTPL